MDIKLKKYSHLLIMKVLAFVVVVLCFTSAFTIFWNTVIVNNDSFEIILEDSYFLGNDYLNESSDVVESLRRLQNYKSEEHILGGGTLIEDQLLNEEDNLFREFRYNSRSYNPNLSTEENYTTFKEVYADKLAQVRTNLIHHDLTDYKLILQKLANYQGIIYYANNGENEFTNSPNKAKDYFKSFPSYMVFDGSEQEVYPQNIKESARYYWVTPNIQLGQKEMMYIAFTEDYLNPRISEWKDDKVVVTNSLYQIAGLLLAVAIALIYLVLVIGRKPREDQRVQLNSIDRIYNDFNIGMCISLISLWVVTLEVLDNSKIYELIFPLTLLIASLGLLLGLSLVKHLKNRTLIKHTLTFAGFYKLFKFIREIYNSGTVGVKVVLIVVGYPIIVAITFFMFPITLGAAAWIALKKVKEFKAIKEGVKQVKEGDVHYTIDVPGDGEFAQLAADINSITDGLYKAVESETKSERLKAELITNVSHDIRTPLTSIITYVDLMKGERDQTKVEDYLEIIDQKSQRLKALTEDLFEAAKASSGTIPVNFEKLDIIALITQGLGELDDKLQERKLEFKIKHPNDKVYIKADGKLLWRAVENLLSNIFKYALEGSRVYIDIIDLGTEVTLVIKNISAYELNISSEELMERFKRGDESRSSQGSGLGLSISKSLIELQKGSFKIEIDGDLFKAIIQLTKA